MPKNTVNLVHSFGYECLKHSNIGVIASTLFYAAGTCQW